LHHHSIQTMALTRNYSQRNSSWNAPYTFSGKEKDAETGYGYFGARYYDSGLSIWLSVDPMSDKYPSMSPYNYCANNPVKLIDPNGMEIVDNEGGPDGPMGKGDGPAPNQSTNKPAPLKFPTSNNLPNRQANTSQTVSTPTNNNSKKKSPSFNFNINLNGGGGVHFYNKSDRDRSGPTRKTDKDVNMVDISNFPTGTGSSGAGNVLELIGNMVGLFERGGSIAEVYLEYQEQIKKEEYERFQNEIILLENPCPHDPAHWLDKDLLVRRKDSLAKIQQLLENCN